MQKIQKFNNPHQDSLIKRNYSLEEVKKLYEDYFINFNIKNVLLKKNPYFKVKFIPLKYLYQDIKVNFYLNKAKDPFITSYKKEIELAESIIEKGTYFPIIVLKKANKRYLVLEGNHRIYSLKCALKKKIIDKNFKIFCIIFSTLDDITLDFSLSGRYIIENLYGPKCLIDKNYLKNCLIDLKYNLNGKIVDKYVVEIETKSLKQIYNFCLWPAGFLRDLIFQYQEEIKPARIINDENFFLEQYKANIN